MVRDAGRVGMTFLSDSTRVGADEHVHHGASHRPSHSFQEGGGLERSPGTVGRTSALRLPQVVSCLLMD